MTREGKYHDEKTFRNIIAGALAGLLVLTTCAPAFAADDPLTPADVVAAIHEFNFWEDRVLWEELSFSNADQRMPAVDASALPAKLDLRDLNGKNYVSPVKNQSPWGTCWSFGGIAAAETSIAYDNGHDYNNETDKIEAKLLDLSEKHLAWFTYTPLPLDNEAYPSQGGEGCHVVLPENASPNTISEKTYNIGGVYNYATTMFSAGVGPALESGAPYRKTTEAEYKKITLVVVDVTEDGHYNMDNTFMETYDPSEATVEELIETWTALGFEEIDPMLASILFAGSVYYPDGIPEYDGEAMKIFAAFEVDGNGDWTLDEDLRFMTAYLLKDGNMLPSPALRGENGEYFFNQVGVDAIKSEIARGRAVSIAFCADQSLPGQEMGENGVTYMSFVGQNGQRTDDEMAEYWAQYTYDPEYDPADKSSVNKTVSANHAVCVVGYDGNFPIRSYPQSEVFTVLNYNNSLEDSYTVGETLEGRVNVTNNTDIDFTDDTEIELFLTIGRDAERSIGKINAFRPRVEREFTYHYTVTEEDAAAGEPEPTGTAAMFSDVPADQYYAKAVAWAVENGITNGTGDGMFSPDTAVTRAQTVTFLFRALSGEAGLENPFADVEAGAYYYDAVLWAVGNGITDGTSATTFSPDEGCLRAQIVTFLYRAYNGK